MDNKKINIYVTCHPEDSMLGAFGYVSRYIGSHYIPLSFKLCKCDKDGILYKGTHAIGDKFFYFVNGGICKW